MTMSAALQADPASPWHPPVPVPSTSRDTWRNERGVFAAAELGWLADEARRRLHRAGGGRAEFLVLDNVHLAGDVFALLAGHPRLLARAEELLEEPVEIAATRLHCGSLVQPLLPLDGGAVVIVPLGWRAEAPLGDVSIGTRPPRAARFEWPLLVAYRPLRTAPPPRLSDDCLWPSASIVAG